MSKPRAPGHRLADAPKTNQAESGAGDVRAQQQHRPPGLPAAGARELIRLNHPPRGGHEQRPGEIGGGVGEHTRSVAHRDAAGGGGSQVNIVDAHGHLADDLKTWRGCLQQRRIDRVSEQGEQAGHGLGPLQQQLVRRRQLAGPDVHVGHRAQGGQARLENLPGNEHFG
jgi:hypothetical protein